MRKRKGKPKKRDLMALHLWQPLYRMKVVPNKKKERNKKWTRTKQKL